MAQPSSYIMDVRNPFEQSLAGVQQALQISGSMRERDFMDQRAKLLQAQEAAAGAEADVSRNKLARQEAFQADVGAIAGNPTPSALASLMAKYPDVAEQLKTSYNALNDEQRKSKLLQAQQIYAATLSGKTDVAQSLLATQIEAMKNSGMEQDAQVMQSLSDLIKISPETAATSVGSFVAAVMDPDKFAETFSKLEEDRRAREKTPIELKKLTAEAKVKELEAQFAPDKLAAELGLTKEQIEQAKAARRASDASARKSNADAARSEAESKQIGAGIIPAEKRPEAEAKLRKEYSDQTKAYQDVKAAYGRVKATNPDAAGDLSLIFNYMKMLDPGSTVREGEFATAQNAGGIDDKARNLYNRIASGERLTDGQRKMFIGQANKLYKSALEQEQTVRSGIGRIAQRAGLSLDNVFYEARESEPTGGAGRVPDLLRPGNIPAPAGRPQPSAGQRPAAPAAAPQRSIIVDY
jgi:hypothetical protein